MRVPRCMSACCCLLFRVKSVDHRGSILHFTSLHLTSNARTKKDVQDSCWMRHVSCPCAGNGRCVLLQAHSEQNKGTLPAVQFERFFGRVNFVTLMVSLVARSQSVQKMKFCPSDSLDPWLIEIEEANAMSTQSIRSCALKCFLFWH